MHPLYDTRELSDDKIAEKLNKAYLHRSQQAQLGHSSAVESIDAVIDSLELERQTRFGVLRQKEIEKANPKLHDPLNFGEVEEIDMEKQYENWK